MIVWVVMVRPNADMNRRRFTGVFSTAEKANEFRNKMPWPSEYITEGHELDALLLEAVEE